jgi:hypothetical protein
LGWQGSDDLADALVTEKFGQRHSDLVKVAASQFDKVRRTVVFDGAIDRRVQIGPERQERNLRDAQPIGVVQTGGDALIGEVSFFEHGSR